MATTIGGGIVGASSHRGWARAAHVPALHALPGYEIRAVSTTRRDTAEQSAREIGALLAFDSHQALIARPEIDLVVVAVNVTHHHEIVRAALSAGKMVYCEWPLARNLAEAEDLAALASKQGVKTVVGLQGRVAPAVLFLRDLVAEGHIGRLLGTRVAGTGPDDLWIGMLAPEFEITADPSSGNTLLAIPNGHALEMLSFALGEFASVSSTLVAARGQAVRLRDTTTVPFKMYDQIAYCGQLENGALASVCYHGGPSVDSDFVWEVYGTEGTLALSTKRGYANISPLAIHRVRGGAVVEELPIPEKYRLAPADLTAPVDNVAALYTLFAQGLAGVGSLAPDFDAAVRRHRVIDAIEQAHLTGERKTVMVGPPRPAEGK
jgi:predicted dehydrogenase